MCFFRLWFPSSLLEFVLSIFRPLLLFMILFCLSLSLSLSLCLCLFVSLCLPVPLSLSLSLSRRAVCLSLSLSLTLSDSVSFHFLPDSKEDCQPPGRPGYTRNAPAMPTPTLLTMLVGFAEQRPSNFGAQGLWS